MDEVVLGRVVLDEEVVPARVTVTDGWISSVEPDERGASGPIVTPGFVDLHVHGWGGHAAIGGPAAVAGMAGALLRHGVTSFLPTAPSIAVADLLPFGDHVRAAMSSATDDVADILGFNLEGPFLAPARRGAHDLKLLITPAEFDATASELPLDGLRVVTIAPELPGALALIERLAARGVAVSIGHSAGTLEDARAGYAAGARTTTHLFNAMTGVDHHSPGVAVAALTEDAAFVELIADGDHVHPALWPIITRTKPADRLVLVSDALPIAGMGDGDTSLGDLQVEVRNGRATLAGTSTLAGSVIALDTALRNLVRSGLPLPAAVAAATSNPLAIIGQRDRGRIAVGQRAHLVELNDDLEVVRVTRGHRWIEGAA